ncbi:glycosyltransferase, partial [Escherichia coli]
VGGSQGARILNQTMPQVAAKLGDSVTIWHQSGKGSQQSVEQAYAEAGQPQHKVTEFIDDMAAAYAWADVVVCRSGALTVTESPSFAATCGIVWLRMRAPWEPPT